MLVMAAAACTASAPKPPPTTYDLSFPPPCATGGTGECRTILVIGDSVAEGVGFSLTNDSRWQDQVAFALAGGGRDRVARRRYDGEVLGTGTSTHWDFTRAGFSAAMWANLPGYLPPAAAFGHLDQIVLALGANDEGQNVPPVVYGVALRSLLSRFPADRCAIVASWEWEAAFKPTGFTPVYPAGPYRAEAAAVAEERGCAFVDESDLTPTGVAAPPWSPDGQHLSQQGHDEIARRLLDAIAAT